MQATKSKLDQRPITAKVTVQRMAGGVDALADPERILERGFVLVQQDGRTLTHASMADGTVTLRWRDGTRTARPDPNDPSLS